MDETMGTRIAALRKQRELTQEALGNAVGVSAQAVSKWENGGTPDVELLPAIADTLGVSIDDLFGRTNTQVPDVEQVLFDHIAALPMEQRMERLCRLVWVGQQAILEKHAHGGPEPYLASSCTDAPERYWIRCAIEDDYGILLGCPSEELHFFGIFPEPKQGYAAYLDDVETTRAMLACLGRPHRLETLCWLATFEESAWVLLTAEALAARRGISVEAARECLDDLLDNHLLATARLMRERDEVRVYEGYVGATLVPFLLLCRWVGDDRTSWASHMYNRNSGFLRQVPGEDAP
jgi:transcriptional regulator with XRE-family HTH domain